MRPVGRRPAPGQRTKALTAIGPLRRKVPATASERPSSAVRRRRGVLRGVTAVAATLLAYGAVAMASQQRLRPEGVETLHRLDGLSGLSTLRLRSQFYGYQSGIDRDTTDGEAAYDYSVHIIRDRARGVYRMYTGGRWLRRGVPRADGDHVLQHVSPNGAAGTWRMPHPRPEFWIPAEEGRPDVWYADNCLEPEVLKVKGLYYMYCQVQGNSGKPLPGEEEPRNVDRIILFTSTDGDNWSRASTKRGVVVYLDEPERTQLHHQEVIYVPWDRDKRPWWMYVFAERPGLRLGYCRIRSSDPTTFDWRLREMNAGLSQLGNQMAYARQAPGGPVFVRITFGEDPSGRQVPMLQLSRDGMRWVASSAQGPLFLDGSKDNADNPNCYFLGISTLDGTGELEYMGSGRFRAVYGATTSKTPVAPEIFRSEVGIGVVEMTFAP